MGRKNMQSDETGTIKKKRDCRPASPFISGAVKHIHKAQVSVDREGP